MSARSCEPTRNDAADAYAIWTAARQPGMPSVPVKTEDQQALLGLHRIRSELVDTRTRRVNQLRGLLGEFGLHFTTGRRAGLVEIRTRREEIEKTVPPVLWSALARQLDEIRRQDEQILEIEHEISNWLSSHASGQVVEEIPGIGPITATALVATMGSAQAFRSGRAFAASLDRRPEASRLAASQGIATLPAPSFAPGTASTRRQRCRFNRRPAPPTTSACRLQAIRTIHQ